MKLVEAIKVKESRLLSLGVSCIVNCSQNYNILLSWMLTAVIGGNLSNQSVGTGEWTFVSCKILCTQNELVVWFVNGSVLSSLEPGLFQRSPNTGHSHCNNISSPKITTHGLSIRFDHQFLYIPVNVYCAVISICDITSNNCSPTTCFSDIAYLEGKPCSIQYYYK